MAVVHIKAYIYGGRLDWAVALPRLYIIEQEKKVELVNQSI